MIQMLINKSGRPFHRRELHNIVPLSRAIAAIRNIGAAGKTGYLCIYAIRTALWHPIFFNQTWNRLSRKETFSRSTIGAICVRTGCVQKLLK